MIYFSLFSFKYNYAAAEHKINQYISCISSINSKWNAQFCFALSYWDNELKTKKKKKKNSYIYLLERSFKRGANNFKNHPPKIIDSCIEKNLIRAIPRTLNYICIRVIPKYAKVQAPSLTFDNFLFKGKGNMQTRLLLLDASHFLWLPLGNITEGKQTINGSTFQNQRSAVMIVFECLFVFICGFQKIWKLNF